MTTPNPSRIVRHDARPEGWVPPQGDDHMQQISDHIERHVGPIAMVFHELVSDHVHVDVHHVAPTAERPWHTLITSGMSDLPMQAPEGMEECRHAELLIELPADWPLNQADWRDERNYWPIRWLKMLARMPHEYRTWLWYGHTIPNGGETPEPFADDTRLCGMMLTFPYSLPVEFFRLTVKDGQTIHFWSLWPLHREEMDYKVKNGAEALEERFTKRNVGPVVDRARPNVCRRWWGLF